MLVTLPGIKLAPETIAPLANTAINCVHYLSLNIETSNVFESLIESYV
jgi:hypothetical protein